MQEKTTVPTVSMQDSSFTHRIYLLINNTQTYLRTEKRRGYKGIKLNLFSVRLLLTKGNKSTSPTMFMTLTKAVCIHKTSSMKIIMATMVTVMAMIIICFCFIKSLQNVLRYGFFLNFSHSCRQ